jgi:hypothetical protein
MSFRPANFTDIQRSGPPTTSNGTDWSIPISKQPPDEWLQFFKQQTRESASVTVEWAPNTHIVSLRFSSTPQDVRGSIESLDGRIAQANDTYRTWLEEAHRKGEARRLGERTEADRVRDLNERFKDL